MSLEKSKIISHLALLFIGGVVLTLGDLVATKWIRFGGGYLYFLVFVFYLFGMMLLVRSYKSEDIPVASLIMVIFNIIILFFAGFFLFDESINLTKIIGILLCFISIFLLEFGKRKSLFVKNND